MIITRTPLRLCLAGGGTDLPVYYEKYGGMVLSATINKYIYVGVRATTRTGYSIKIGDNPPSHNSHVKFIKHDIIREVIKGYKLDAGYSIQVLGDVPGGTGLGSS